MMTTYIKVLATAPNRDTLEYFISIAEKEGAQLIYKSYFMNISRLYIPSGKVNYLTEIANRLGISLEAETKASIKQFRAMGRRVEKVYLDEVLSTVNAYNFWKLAGRGRNVKIAILDTGVNEHEMLQNKVLKRYTTVPNSDVYDDNGHGTFVASVAAGREVEQFDRRFSGVAPEASIISIKVLNSRGEGNIGWIIEGIDYALLEGVDAINMSISNGMVCSPAMIHAIDVAASKGIPVVAAAGNSDGLETVPTPGACPSAIAVASISLRIRPFKPSAFSTIGPGVCGFLKPDIAAPGGDIDDFPAFSLLEGIMAADHEDPYGYVPMAGTSVAAPVVCGLLSIMKKAIGRLDRKKLEYAMYHMHKKVKNTRTGYGLIDPVAMFKSYGLTVPLATIQYYAPIILATAALLSLCFYFWK